MISKNKQNKRLEIKAKRKNSSSPKVEVFSSILEAHKSKKEGKMLKSSEIDEIVKKLDGYNKSFRKEETELTKF